MSDIEIFLDEEMSPEEKENLLGQIEWLLSDGWYARYSCTVIPHFTLPSQTKQFNGNL